MKNVLKFAIGGAVVGATTGFGCGMISRAMNHHNEKVARAELMHESTELLKDLRKFSSNPGKTMDMVFGATMPQ